MQSCIMTSMDLKHFCFSGSPFFLNIIFKIIFCDCIGIKMDIFILHIKTFLTTSLFSSCSLKKKHFCVLLKILCAIGIVPTVPNGAVGPVKLGSCYMGLCWSNET